MSDLEWITAVVCTVGAIVVLRSDRINSIRRRDDEDTGWSKDPEDVAARRQFFLRLLGMYRPHD